MKKYLKKTKITVHSQNILLGDTLNSSIIYIKRKKYKTVCAELTFAQDKISFDRWVMIVVEFVILLYLLCS